MSPWILRRAFHIHRACRATAQSIDSSNRSINNTHEKTKGKTYIQLVEVGPRDGLQNEKKPIPVATKMKLIARLAATGLTRIEAGSFVSPKWVPQMEGSSQILEQLLQKPNLYPDGRLMTYSFLVPNMRGFDNLAQVLSRHSHAYQLYMDDPVIVEGAPAQSPDAGPHKPTIEVAVFAAATESFSRRNLNCSIDVSLQTFSQVIAAAKAQGLRVRAYISVVLGCPFEGPNTDPRRVVDIALSLLEAGADEISLGDTTGMGTAPRTKELLQCLSGSSVMLRDIALHFHDTYGQALINTLVSIEHGIRTFDASVGGLGGCPYSPGATGNVSTETMVYFLESMGLHTGVDLDAMVDVGQWISQQVERPNASSVGRAIHGARGAA